MSVTFAAPHQYRKALAFAEVNASMMWLAQLKPEPPLPSSHALVAESKLDHSVSHAGLLVCDSGEVGAEA